MINIEKVLNESLQERCVFHSEADFQHHFAWFIHLQYPDLEVRLEYPISKDENSRWEYCDIVIIGASEKIGIELKYKTKKTKEDIVIKDKAFDEDETFELKNQGAQDLGRYDYLKDISRLERWCAGSERRFSRGYAILLTNDLSYLRESIKDDPVDRDFRIHEGREISGCLAWLDGASKGTKKGREKSINLRSSYTLEWSPVPNHEFKDRFKFLFLKIK